MAKIAVDTNVLVRLIVQDDSEQLALAKPLLEAPGMVVMPTVLLETAWVLRRAYRYERARIAGSFRTLLALPGIEVIEEARVMRSVDWFEAGMDFADALHLAGADDCDEFVTFDRDFARRAATIADAVPVRLL